MKEIITLGVGHCGIAWQDKFLQEIANEHGINDEMDAK